MEQTAFTRTIIENGEGAGAPSPEYSTMDDVFGRFDEIFKQYKEDTKYEDWKEVRVLFNSNMLVVDDTTDIEIIIDELNNISRKLFSYGYVYESQQKVVQKLEEDFDTWLAEKYIIVDTTPVEIKEGMTVKYVKRTETAKEKLIIMAYNDEYTRYKTKIADEKFKLGIVSRALKGLENYSYKLDSILKYRQMCIQRGL